MTTAYAPLPATPKQRAFISRLGGNALAPDLTRDAASQLIAELLKNQQPVEPVTEPGMYRGADGAIYKVQRSKGDATRLYAKVLTAITGERLRESDDAIVAWEFRYAAGAVRSLTPSQRLTLDEAKAFGIRYGVCCVCGITLKDATSVQAGIGPVCRTRL